jgi:type IV pilus assembly protein PilW
MMSHKPFNFQGRISAAVVPSQRGITLIELMTGLVLGLLTTVVIAQVLATSEAQRRGTAIGSDAQTNGTVALYSLQREVTGAGYGMSERRDIFGCPLVGEIDGVAIPFNFSPLAITPGATADAPDELTVVSAAHQSFASPMRVTAGHIVNSATLPVNHSIGVEPGDVLLALPPPPGVAVQPSASTQCTVLNASNVAAGSVGHAVGSAFPWNSTAGTGPMAGQYYQAESTLINMGTLSARRFAIGARDTLTESVFDPKAGTWSAAQDMFSNVVNMQVFYGRNTTPFPGLAGGLVPTREQASVDVYDATAPSNGNSWRDVRTVRLVLVTRSAQRERDIVTTALPVVDLGASPAVTDSVACGTSQCLSLSVGSDPDWKHYKYKVFDTTVPLRNILWNQQ